MKILIKGAGDIATGVALRLHACGYSILMTEIPTPSTIRRTVAFSEAIYTGKAQVENVLAVKAKNINEALEIQSEGNIPVIVDPEGKVINTYNPEVVIDAIIGKININTTLTQAPIVIGIGPGFTAPLDCHCVIESSRGHYLGKCIYSGSPLANTGIPGDIGGYSIERIIRAPQKGLFSSKAKIGTFVTKGQLVGEVGYVPVYSPLSGVLRGLIADNYLVQENMKIGDVDPRGIVDYCYSCSDKARAIAGGVLEAILHLNKKERY